MSDITPYREDPPPAIAISQTDFKPKDSADNPSLFRRFVDFIRQNIGLKPLHLAERFAEAELRKREADAEKQEVENQVTILKAKQEFELIQAEIRRKQLESESTADREKAMTEAVRADTRSKKASARIQEVAAREIERLGQTPEEAVKRLHRLVNRLRSQGGDIEISPLDEPLGSDDDKIPPEFLL